MRFQRRSEQSTGIDFGPVSADRGRSGRSRSHVRFAFAASLALAQAAVLASGAWGVPLAVHASPDSNPLSAPILGAVLAIVADGTAPFEDRPIDIPGMGTIPGTRGVADPGDDTGPHDRVVRSWDTVTYRLAISIREAPADDLIAEVVLTGPAVWDVQQLAALELTACRGGASVHDEGRRLSCDIGRIEAPPAVTTAVDLIARVDGDGPQGAVITAAASVRGPGIEPDPDPARCHDPRENGCDTGAPDISVSSAPAAELRKFLVSVGTLMVDEVPGRSMKWRLDAVLGADGDVRGTSAPIGGPWVLPDWWRATGRGASDLDLPIKLIGCTEEGDGATWSCDQPAGDGTPVEVILGELDLSAVMGDRTASTLPKVVGSVEIELWVPEADLVATGWDVQVHNCFATAIGRPDEALWAPVDATGQPNLNGLSEPTENNCAAVVLPVPRAPGRSAPPRTPRPPRTGTPHTPRPPRATPTPPAVVSKRYTPLGQGDSVAEGSVFAAEVAVKVLSDTPLPGVIACDMWDNSTQTLRDDDVDGVRVWWRNTDGDLAPMEPDNVIVEYGRGPWGADMPEHVSLGERWYKQSVSTCSDTVALAPPGWTAADGVDFLDAGGGAIDARDVNMVRARFVDPVPVGVEVWIEVLLRAKRNPAGTWLMNYGAGAWGAGSAGSPAGGVWVAEECFGASGTGRNRVCPKPRPGARGRPGPIGDMLYHVGVPVWLRKLNDPPSAEGSPIIPGGETAAFTLRASTYPKPGDPPPPDYPPGVSAVGVVVTDTIPAGMTFEVGSATVSSEDLNGNGVLDPGEDLNGNGRIDLDVPFEPLVTEPEFLGVTTLVWGLGDLPFETESAVIRYQARVSRLVRAGTALTNWAGVTAEGDPLPACMPTFRRPRGDIPLQLPPREVVPGLCAWAQVIVANIGAAQVEKVSRPGVVAPGEDMVYRLGLANLASRPAEWFDAVDILPRPGEPRDPTSRLGGSFEGITVTGDGRWPPMEFWASATDPDVLDTGGGGARDGLVDPVTAWGGGVEGGAGLGGADWPCRLADVGTTRCRWIDSFSEVTALRFWGPDPEPDRTGFVNFSFLAVDSPPRFIDVALRIPESKPGDIAHNAWGGRFEGLPLPVFDSAVIRVPPEPTPTPTMTATPESSPTPTPSASLTPPLTPTPTPAVTASATATGTVHRIYLPTTLRGSCESRDVDVALVIDVSSSMLRPADDLVTKLEAVQRAAQTFIDSFEPSTDLRRVALVAFNERAWVVEPMTGDRTRLERAIAGLEADVAEGTRLDLGLLAGADALDESVAGRWRAMVFLTDGLPNRVPTPEAGGRQEDTVLAAAERVRSADIQIYTVGYGRVDAPDIADRISPELLRAIAGDSARYYETDDAGVLAVLFRRIAAEIGCIVESGT